jgi:hypothetical protein
MPYVMVPVPEEYVEEVMQYILNASARAELTPWDAESLGAFYSAIDEASRSLLSFVARAMTDGRGLPDTEAAAALELSVREVAGIMRDVNEQARQLGHPWLLSTRTVSDVLANGRTRERRLFTMNDDNMLLVLEAERSDRVKNPLPLDVDGA